MPERIALSRRERQVMALVAEGLSYKVIGAKLFIAENTVSSHVCRVVRKLGAKNATHAVVLLERLPKD